MHAGMSLNSRPHPNVAGKYQWPCYAELVSTERCLKIATHVIKISLPFTEPEGSLQHLQETTTGPYPESYESSPHPHNLFLLNPFNNILISTSRSTKLPLPILQFCIHFLFSQHVILF
jgi:hypothetical protein